MEVNQPQGNINTDLELIKTIIGNKESKQWSRPPNLQSLTAILRFKNKASDPLRPDHLERGREWLIKKGVNLEPLLTKLAFSQKQPKQQQQQTVSDNYFHVVLSERTLPEYLDKAQEYGTMAIMQKIMSGSSFRKKFTAKFLGAQLSQGPNKFPIWQCQNQKERRNVYINLVKKVGEIKGDRQNVIGELLKEFRSASGQLGEESFWGLLSFQLQTYNRSVPKHVNMTRMFVISLKLIHQEFQKRLHGQDFERYLSKNYIARAEGRWPFEHGGLWAKVWLYYCLGQEKDVNDLLSSSSRDYRDLGRLYNAAEEALKSAKPIKEKYLSRYEVEDVFFEQFVFNVTGQSRYSCDIMTDSRSLELILILIRTLGVFYETERDKFEQVRGNLLRNYRDYASDPQVMRNMLYLLSYDEIVKMGPNSLMSSDDYLHFLIILSGYPEIVDQSRLEPILTQKLVQFIVQLISEGKSEYIYYIPLLPPKNLLTEVSSIVLSSNAVDTFNWKGVKQLINEEIYNNLVYSTVEKFRIREKGELKAAKKIRELAEDQEKAFSYLVQLIVNHYLNLCKYSKEEVQEAEELGITWSKEQGTPRVYEHLFKFFHSLRVLLSLLVKRNEETLRSFVSNSQFITLDMENSNSIKIRMLELLGELNGLNVYFYFLRLVVKAMEIYASRVGEGDKLNVMKRMIREQVEIIERVRDLKMEMNSWQLSTLKEEITVQAY